MGALCLKFVARFPADRLHVIALSYRSGLAKCDEARRKQIERIAANPTPFKAGTMLAALDRACQSSEQENTPIHQLRRSARDLAAALAAAIAEAEATRDANLRKSL